MPTAADESSLVLMVLIGSVTPGLKGHSLLEESGYSILRIQGNTPLNAIALATPDRSGRSFLGLAQSLERRVDLFPAENALGADGRLLNCHL